MEEQPERCDTEDDGGAPSQGMWWPPEAKKTEEMHPSLELSERYTALKHPDVSPGRPVPDFSPPELFET